MAWSHGFQSGSWLKDSFEKTSLNPQYAFGTISSKDLTGVDSAAFCASCCETVEPVRIFSRSSSTKITKVRSPFSCRGFMYWFLPFNVVVPVGGLVSPGTSPHEFGQRVIFISPVRQLTSGLCFTSQVCPIMIPRLPRLVT